MFTISIISGKNKVFITIVLTMMLLFCLFTSKTIAQQEEDLGTQSITIYTDYTIVLQDANRVQFLPTIVDTIKVEPTFNYSISPIPFDSRFTPTPINAASLREEPLPALDNGFINLAVGNYLSPLIEIYYNTTYQQNYSAGAYAKHHSAHGKTKNALDQKIYNGFNNNKINVYGKRFFHNATLSGDIDFNSNEIFYYGYDPELEVFSKPRDKGEMEMQRWMNLNPRVQLSSNNIDGNRMNYDMFINYNYLFNLTNDYHHGLNIGADMHKPSGNRQYGMEGRFIYHNDYIADINDEDKYLMLNPYFKSFTNEWQIKLGANTTGEFFEDSVEYHFYPNILIQHNISNTIIPYVSFKGYLEDNCINSMRLINPYIQRISDIEVTNYAQVLDIGLKGNISRNMYFHINGNYSKIDNMPFFVNDISEELNNKFILEYTNVERFSGYGEISLRNISNFNFLLKANYYYYSYLKNREKPWHMPELDVSFSAEYEYTRDIKFGADVFFVGKRYAKEYNDDFTFNEKELSPIVDINLYGKYTVASNFNTFINLNNILGQKQYVWNNYHSMGFNLLLGLQYSF